MKTMNKRSGSKRFLFAALVAAVVLIPQGKGNADVTDEVGTTGSGNHCWAMFEVCIPWLGVSR